MALTTINNSGSSVVEPRLWRLHAHCTIRFHSHAHVPRDFIVNPPGVLLFEMHHFCRSPTPAASRKPLHRAEIEQGARVEQRELAALASTCAHLQPLQLLLTLDTHQSPDELQPTAPDRKSASPLRQ